MKCAVGGDSPPRGGALWPTVNALVESARLPELHLIRLRPP